MLGLLPWAPWGHTYKPATRALTTRTALQMSLFKWHPFSLSHTRAHMHTLSDTHTPTHTYKYIQTCFCVCVCFLYPVALLKSCSFRSRLPSSRLELRLNFARCAPGRCIPACTYLFSLEGARGINMINHFSTNNRPSKIDSQHELVWLISIFVYTGLFQITTPNPLN